MHDLEATRKPQRNRLLEGRRSDPPARGGGGRRRRSKEDELVFILRTIILSAVENHLVTRKNTGPCEKSRKKPEFSCVSMDANRRPAVRDLHVLSLSFFFVFLAYGAIQNLESSLLKVKEKRSLLVPCPACLVEHHQKEEDEKEDKKERLWLHSEEFGIVCVHLHFLL